mmetsp:Transcript_7502/g.9792  ORF Transcript_7502/g.9792 Transcript_7502/m.9792 type:complete len:224 (-) Transcript_7502:200-871(-)
MEENDFVVDLEEVLGQYCIDGSVYLQGNLHEDLLLPGTVCEALVVKPVNGVPLPKLGLDQNSDDADWETVRIQSISVRSVEKEESSVSVVVRVFHVKGLNWDMSVVAQSVESKDIRIKAPAPPVQPPSDSEVEYLEGLKLGLSGWSTVTVRTIPDVEVQIKEEPKPEEVGVSNEVEGEKEEEEFPEEKPTMFTGFEAAPDAETLLQEPKKKTAKFKKRKRKKT